MRRKLLLIAVSLAVLVAGGCGIPDDSRVTVVKTGRAAGVPAGDPDRTPTQHTRDSATSSSDLVNYYLAAAAGDAGTALDRVKAFMSPNMAASYDPGSTDDVKVVRPVGTPKFDAVKPTLLLIRVTEIGTLSGDGVFTPSTAPTVTPYTFEIDHLKDKDGLFILKAPPVLMMSDTALDTFYEQRTIYWWNMEYTGLVPDVRYMPLSVPTEQQPTTVLTWLTGKPADWLNNYVEALPETTKVAQNVPAMRDGTLQISLDASAIPANDNQALDRLGRQLQWSMRSLDARTLELTIGSRNPVSFSSSDYLTSNASYQLADRPERFAIYGGVIRRIKDSPRGTDPVPVLKSEANKNITAAAMSVSATHTFAAVITGTGENERLRTAAAPLGEQVNPKVVGGLSGTLGRPVWATTPDGDPSKAVGLITANGQLYSFRANGGTAQRVTWQAPTGQLTSLSVAPDGRRVALVAGGRLYRAMIDYSGDAPELSTPSPLLPPIFDKVTAVAWSGEAYLAVAGSWGDGRYAVHDVTVDGALESRSSGIDDIGTSPVTYLTAYPANPTQSASSGFESYEAGDRAWDVLGDPSPVNVEDLAGPIQGAKAGAPTTDPFFLL